jgi:hypothetical protein
MDFAFEDVEFVYIASNFRAFDEDWYQRKYVRPDNIPLDPGVYIVRWPNGIVRRRFDEHAVYEGPFQCLAAARAALQRRLAERIVLAHQADEPGAAAPAGAGAPVVPTQDPDPARRDRRPLANVPDAEANGEAVPTEREHRKPHDFVDPWAMH